jgi:hypothetical protein
MPFNEYVEIRDDFQDLEDKIVETLKNDRYKEIAQSSYDAYNLRHNPDKCFEKYFEVIKKHAGELL